MIEWLRRSLLPRSGGVMTVGGTAWIRIPPNVISAMDQTPRPSLQIIYRVLDGDAGPLVYMQTDGEVV